MAEVWYAENEIGKKAAVKVLLPKFCADEAIVARFQNEAKVNDGSGWGVIMRAAGATGWT